MVRLPRLFPMVFSRHQNRGKGEQLLGFWRIDIH
jgi:hypothetical protein